jgi:prepilin-type N-terminal cleavage/methylation domain-containing protein
MKRSHGFTMVEMMIVMEIIVLLMAIAYPQLRRSLISAREGNAVGSMKLLVGAQVGFKEAGFVDFDSNGEGDFGTLAQLFDPDGAGATQGFIDEQLATGIKSGYIFTIAITAGSSTTPPSYAITGIPTVPGVSAYKMFFADESGIIRVTADGTPVGPASPSL